VVELKPALQRFFERLELLALSLDRPRQLGAMLDNLHYDFLPGIW
jgi:hypothetical protein